MTVTGTPGTGTITLGAAFSDAYFTFAEAGVANTDVVAYVLEDGDDFEIGIGTYTSAGTTLSRDTVTLSKEGGTAGTAKITASSASTVFLLPRKEDLGSLSETNTWAAQQTFSAVINLTGGGIAFPATQAASGDANTLDDYEEGTFTPVLSFDTPGNLSVAYTIQGGVYTKIGRFVNAQIQIQTSTFTHTTASGNVLISGLPFTIANARTTGPLRWAGITKASYTHAYAAGSTGVTTVNVIMSASGMGAANVEAADMPTGGTVVLIFGYPYSV